MDKIVFGFNRSIFQFPLAMLCFIILGVFAVPPQAIAQTAEPLVAIHVSELTNALDPTADSWHYYVAYESLEEALRSDGTPFIEISDSDIAAGNLSNPDGSPKYPILISLGAAAINNNEITPLSNYVNAGGFLFAGSNSFTLNPDGTSRSDFALAGAMGLDAALNNGYAGWSLNNQFTKQVSHQLTSQIPNGTLFWDDPLTSDEIPSGISPTHVINSNHYAFQVTASHATVLATGTVGPLLTVNSYGSGQIIYDGRLQPLIGHGGYDVGMYSYLIYRNAIEWAFESFSLPIVKVSPWRYQYDAAVIFRHDFENNQASINSIASSAQFEQSYGGKGEYYFCTGALRQDMGNNPTTIASLRSAVSQYGATIGSHNGGLPNPVNLSLTELDYDYWHWGPDEVLDITPPGYANGQAYASASILASFQDIAGWLSGLDNGRTGCGAAGNCPRTWVSPYFNSTREGSREIIDQLGAITMGEQKIGPFPHRSLSYDTPGKYYSSITLPVSEWFIGNTLEQTITYNDGTTVYAVSDIDSAIDFYYGLGALINFYGHQPSNALAVAQENVTHSLSKPNIWSTNSVGVHDWWLLRSNVVVTPTVTSTGNIYTVTASVSGATDPGTSVEIVLPQNQTVSNMSVFLNGALAGPSAYRTTNYGSLKVLVGSSVSSVQVQYSLSSSPVAVNDSYSTNQNTALTVAAPGVLSNDTDPQGKALTAQLVGGPTHGALTLNSNGSFTYTPTASYTGSDSFTYQANDGTLTSATATVTITINAVTNPIPATTSISPTSVAPGGSAFTLTVNGSNFINGSVVQWNGSSRTTTYLSATQLTAAITAADIATAGTASVTVFNPAPGGGTSNAQTFTINTNTAATIVQSSWEYDTGSNTETTRSVTLNGVQAGHKLIAVVSTGGNNVVDFTNAGTGVSDGTAFTLDYYVNNSHSSVYTAGTAFYSQQVSTSGNYTVTFTANAAAGLHLAVYEVSGLAAGSAFDSAATGTGVGTTATTATFSTSAPGVIFTTSMEDLYNSGITHSLPANYVVDYQEQDGINHWGGHVGHEISSAIQTNTSVTVTLNYSAYMTRISAAAYKFATGTANNPVPATTSISPTSATAGGSAFTLTVNGSSFINGSVVQWNGSSRTTTYLSATQLTAAITAADIATAGTASVTVFNPAPGGGASNAQTFTINSATNPVPATTSLSPPSAAPGGSAFTLTVNGTGFVNGSVVQWNGSSRTTTYLSATQLTAAITAADIATAGPASVTVFNPAPGGGTSNTQIFTINTNTAAAIVQSSWESDTGSNTETTRSVTLNGVQAGHKLIAVVSTGGNNVVDFTNAATGVSDGTAFTRDYYVNNSHSSVYTAGTAYYSQQVSTGGNYTVTFTANAAAGLHLAVYEVSGLAAGSAFDSAATGTGAGTTATTAAFSTSAPGVIFTTSMEDLTSTGITHSLPANYVVDNQEQDGVNHWGGHVGHEISSAIQTNTSVTVTLNYSAYMTRISAAAYHQ